LVEEGRGQGVAYRDGADARERWREIALRDDVFDATYLEAALSALDPSSGGNRRSVERSSRRTTVSGRSLGGQLPPEGLLEPVGEPRSLRGAILAQPSSILRPLAALLPVARLKPARVLATQA
jgi:hypothetical protein